MASPIPDLGSIRLPYGVTYYPVAGGGVAQIDPAQRNPDAQWHRLAPGHYLLRLVYDGPENVYISFRQVGGGSVTTVANTGHGAAGTPRTCTVPITAGPDGALVRVTSSPLFAQATVDGKYYAGLTVYPTGNFTP